MPDQQLPPELTDIVVATLDRWLQDHIGPLKWLLAADTPIEDAFRIFGDDIWEMLEWLQAELHLDLDDEFSGYRYFTQEGNRFWDQRPVEPLTPGVIARHLRPIPELTSRVMLAISRWCIGSGVAHRRPVLASLWIEDVLSIRGRKTDEMLASVLEQLRMALADDFEPKRHLKGPLSLGGLLRGRPPEPLTPDILARYLRPLA
jgi:hypothetical protein